MVDRWASGPKPADDGQVEAVPVMSTGERYLFIVLSVIAAGAILLFGRHWIVLGSRDQPGASGVPYFVATLLLGFHFASWLARWLLLWRMRRPTPTAPVPGLRVAAATTFVPDAEPIGMLEQAVRALVAMDYPHDTWVLDEGDDPEVAALCERLGARHYSRKRQAQFLTDRGPFARRTKYGNYNAWLNEVGEARYDILAAFDPDHIPEPGFLVRVLGYFSDPDVAYVQVPQFYYNQDTSLIARGAAEESYDYYSTHQMAGYGMGQPNLVGSHNTQRISALIDVGGFAPHDADDLLITLRYRSKGWRGVYLPEVLALGMTPVDWHGYLRQQVRWTASVIDIKLRQLPALVSKLTRTERFLSLFHGFHYMRAFSIPLWYGVLAWLLMRGRDPVFFRPAHLIWLIGLLGLLGVISLYRRRFFLDPEREGGLHWRSALLQFAKWPYQCLATWRAVRGRDSSYALTLKVRRASEGTLVLWPHWLVAAGMTVALAVGFQRHAAPLLRLAAMVVIAGSVAVAASEYRPTPGPWDVAVYRKRRARLANLIGPAQWPSVERRSGPRSTVVAT